MRYDLFKKIDNLPISYLDMHSNGDVISCMTNDVENVSNTVSQAGLSNFRSADGSRNHCDYVPVLLAAHSDYHGVGSAHGLRDQNNVQEDAQRV